MISSSSSPLIRSGNFNDYELCFFFNLNNMFHGYVNLLNIAF